LSWIVSFQIGYSFASAEVLTEGIGSVVPKMQQQEIKAVVTRGLCAGSSEKEWFWETSQRCRKGKSGISGLLALPSVILCTISCCSITCNSSHWRLPEAEDHGAGGHPGQGHRGKDLLWVLGQIEEVVVANGNFL
jgi:hypothetical protein